MNIKIVNSVRKIDVRIETTNEGVVITLRKQKISLKRRWIDAKLWMHSKKRHGVRNPNQPTITVKGLTFISADPLGNGIVFAVENKDQQLTNSN